MLRETLRSNQSLRSVPATSFVTTNPLEAYRYFLPRARAVSSDAIKPCTGDLVLARHNIETGLLAIEPHLDVVNTRLPGLATPLLFELPSLVLALGFAAERMVSTAEGATERHLAQLRFLRNLTLRQLEIFARLGLLPEDRIHAVRVGAEPVDTCREAIAIVAVFTDHAPLLAGKHPFTPTQLDELRERALWLLNILTSRAPVVVTTWQESSTSIRDRFWTLVCDRYDDLREAGAAIFGLRQLDDHVPPLVSRRA